MAMKSRPRLVIEPLWEKLTSLGYTPEELQTEEAPVGLSRQALGYKKRKQEKAEMKGLSHEAFEDALRAEGVDVLAGVAHPFSPIGEKVGCLNDLKFTAIRDHLLPACNTSILSSANLKALTDSEAKSKAGLLKIYEFCTGK